MPRTSNVVAVSDAIAALLPLLAPAERASLAGWLLQDVGLDTVTVEAFASEFAEEELAELARQIY